MTLFPELKEDFTAENGVTYTWEENRWRTKSFLTADGSVVEVGPNPPPNPSEGGLWYDPRRSCSSSIPTAMTMVAGCRVLPLAPA